MGYVSGCGTGASDFDFNREKSAMDHICGQRYSRFSLGIGKLI